MPLIDSIVKTLQGSSSLEKEATDVMVPEKDSRRVSAATDGSCPIHFEDARETALTRLYKGVEVKSRRYRLRTYKRCFVGSEAVDFMVMSGWANTRAEAVQLGRNLQKDFNLFEHVVDPHIHKFEDKYLFYRFNDMATSESSSTEYEEESDMFQYHTKCDRNRKLGIIAVGGILRMGVPKKYNYALDRDGFYANEAIDYLVSVGLATSRRDAVYIGVALQHGERMIENVKSDDSFDDSRLFFSYTEEAELPWKIKLDETKKFFIDNMKVGDHVYRLKTYKNTFTGTEAVDLLMLIGFTSTRQDAVLLGRALMVQYNLFSHVAAEHEFEDAELFYRFLRR
eukprot:Nitzschia sp. Nitz4//scaffold80_size88189//6217//7233//NITZ4_005078-RA/size88189-exonerate_est2genome-gene-0.36-mRNA-1//1//CDS//3329558603//7312//frame0